MVRRTPQSLRLRCYALGGEGALAGAVSPVLKKQRAERCRSALLGRVPCELRRVRSLARRDDDLPKLAVLLFRYSAIMQDVTDEGSRASAE